MNKKTLNLSFLIYLAFAGYSYGFYQSANPPTPPGDGGGGAFVHDVPKVPIDDWHFQLIFVLLFFLLLFTCSKNIFFGKQVPKQNI